MTTEMLCSEAPCAMARTFTAAEPSAWHLRGDAVRTCHTVADFRQDAAAAVDLEALDLPLAQLRVDGAAHEPVGSIRLGGGARKTSHALYCP